MKWLREPLVQFLVGGVLLFGLGAWWEGRDVVTAPEQIVLTEDDLLQMAIALRTPKLPDPDTPAFRSLLETKIREEVLYREALAMGLDRNDTIVKRRMVQKMDFLAEDLSTLQEPSREELLAWFDAHPEDYRFPPRASFRHLFFGFDEHDPETEAIARRAADAARGLGQESPEALALGDPFMFQDYYADRTPHQIATTFGGGFATAVFDLEPGDWAGPIESGYGWHLVFVEDSTPARTPDYDEVADRIRLDWLTDRRTKFKQLAYDAIREKYEVILPESIAGRVPGFGSGSNDANRD
jgi:hypothetical protein